ncbi:MAG TPA: glycosyl hydrolase family 18 protein [Clostridiales bacterium]|nr:glycosyl hydrolase family 18 protein [Clostridiales bacterium]
MKKAFLRTILVTIVLAVIGAFGYSAYYFFFMPNNSITAAFETEGLHLVIEDEEVVSKYPPKIMDDEILLPLEIVKKYFDKTIYWDESLKKVTITTKDRVIRMKTNELEALVNNKPVNLNIPAIEENGEVYIPIEFLSDFYNIDIDYIKSDNVIIIDPRYSMVQIAEPISPKAVIRKGPSKNHPIIKKLQFTEINNETNSYKVDDDNGNSGKTLLRIFKEYDKWYKVRTQEGEIGYIEKKFVSVKWLTVNLNILPREKEMELWNPEAGKINLVWEMMYGQRPDLSKIGKIEGLDVISPTWFQLKDDEGNVINRADATYVDWAHKNGYKIWALFSNDFQDIKASSRFLNNTDARDNAIRQILTYASLYKLDGINIDFENIYKEDKDALTQFVREITPFLKEQGLVVSMDVTIPDGSDTWSKCYDRTSIGEIVDFVMLMAYDQHWSSSPVAGSVAQLSWVENNIVKMLKIVPKEKLLLGLPFYTRLWQEETVKGGRVKVTNPKVLSMDNARKMIAENDTTVKWDEESGQFYSQFNKDGKVYKIWLEDENSINLKSSLVHKYKLAGTAAWRRSDEAAVIWNILNENLKIVNNYQEWQDRNKITNYVYNR